MPIYNTLTRFNQVQGGGADFEVMAYGTSALVSGIVTVATGLSAISCFTATITGTGAKTTGAAEVATLQVVITTGSAVVQGFFNSFVTGTPTISVSGTAPFRWMAIGTP